MNPDGCLPDEALPGCFRSADAASGRGQRRTVGLEVGRLAGVVLAVAAAALGAVTSVPGWLVVTLGGLVVALAAELVLLVAQPERDWYAGRALAESAKTLAWCYAMGAPPFALELDDADAVEVMVARLHRVDELGRDRLRVELEPPWVTPAMTALRHAPFAERRAAYLQGRTQRQHQWYAARARANRRRSRVVRAVLVGVEVLALVLATAGLAGGEPVAVVPVLAALVLAGSAWWWLKQFPVLAVAYATTAAELVVQAAALAAVEEYDWPAAVVDAERAISREHTLWVATRV